MVGLSGLRVKGGFTKVGKRFLAVLLLAAMVAGSVSGCGGAENVNGDSAGGPGGDGSQGDGATGLDGQSWPADTPMGRYVEEAVELPNGLELSGTGCSIHKLNDGSLIIVDAGGSGSMLTSSDNGKHWRESKKAWYNRMMGQGDYIMSVAIGKDNTTAVVWEEAVDSAEEGKAGEERAKEEEAEEGKVKEKEAEVEKEDGEKAEAENPEENNAEEADEKADEEKPEEETQDHLMELDPEFLLVKSDGTEISVEMNLTEEDVWLQSAYISDTGRIFAGTQSPNLYEVKEDGSSELFLTVDDGCPKLVQFHDNMMFMDGWGYDSLLIYDMDAGEYVEDKVLEDFITENYGIREGFIEGNYDMFFMPDDNDTIYIAGEKGLYRHVLGGSAMEQVIDGSLSSFGNPSYRVTDMEILEDNEFLVLFNGGKLIRFTYNPDIPTVPVGKVKVYSLQENATIRQTIGQYQTANPAMYVDYEVGMGEGDSVTREDALKNLNTQIVSGEGPDVLILDNMPTDSYIEKGLLMDIAPILDEMSGENGLFDNMVDAFREGGHVYAVPCEVQMPFILGRSEDVAPMKDLEGIADGVERMRQGNPGDNLLEIASEKGIMRMFSMVSAPAWKTEQGEINSEAISEFLTQTKRIYDAQMDGLPDQDIEDWQYSSDYYIRTMGKPMEDTDYIRMYEGEMGFLGDMRKLVMGSLLDETEYAKQISVTTTEGFEDCEMIPMSGQCDDVFWARTLIGISAASDQSKLAEDFLRIALGKENQMNLQGGMAVNKEALREGFEQKKNQSQNNIYGSYTLSSDDGLYVHLVIRVPEDEEVEDLVKWMESAKTAYVEDVTFENVVYEEGINYMQGTKSLADAVASIEKKMAIYLAE